MRFFSRKKIKRFLNKLSTLCLRFFLAVLKILPRWCIEGIVKGMFAIAFFWVKGIKKIFHRNLSLIYANTKTFQERETMMRSCFHQFGQAMIDMLYYVNHPQEILRVCRFQGEEYLQQAQQKGAGVIGVTAHLGNFPLMFMALVLKGYKVNVLIRPMRDKDFSDFMFSLCAKRDVTMIPTKPVKEFIKKTMTALRQNELLFILLDEVAPLNEGVEVDFWGRKVMRSTGPMLFHERTGASIVPMFITKNADGYFDILIKPELVVEEKFSPKENMVKNISSLTQTIESVIKEYPLEWGGWLNKRWAENDQRQQQEPLKTP